MATMRCICGAILRDDNPDSDCVLMSCREFDIDVDNSVLRGQARDVWRCWDCERLWVFLDERAEPAEYRRAAGPE
jgi:hypothetical protein